MKGPKNPQRSQNPHLESAAWCLFEEPWFVLFEFEADDEAFLCFCFLTNFRKKSIPEPEMVDTLCKSSSRVEVFEWLDSRVELGPWA